MVDEKLAFAPAHEVAGLIAAREVSSVEMTELYFERIDRLDSQLNSYLTLMRDDAMGTARAADEAVARGDSLGPLHGVPISVKDMQMTGGTVTTLGCLAYKDRVPDADAGVIEKVRESGAVILGKTNTPEFGLLGATENRLGDDCRNPWNTERTSGGSSGGAGAAVVAGLCSLATGGDGGGSIRIPASFCGTYGIKPTQGRVSSFNGIASPPIVNITSQQGPMSRTVKDSVILLQALAGHDPRDVGSLNEPVPDFMAALDRDVRGLRIAWSPDYGYAGVDPQVAEACANAVKVFEEMGCIVEDAGPVLESPFETWWVFFASNIFATQGHLLDDTTDPLTWYGRMAFEDGAKFTAADYARALGERDRMINQFNSVFNSYDLIISPTMATTAFPVREYPPEVINGLQNANRKGWSTVPFTHPINTIGHPAASLPCGFDADGLPIGLHLVGRRADEATVIAASAAFERARPWDDRRPSVS
jgi:aspartyl-tRNA(Asn)/glutamyl-tRNA(Gln) amidotransferase subunit A